MGADISADERVVFFPTAAKLAEDAKTWSVPIHGWIFEPEEDDYSRAAALAVLQSALGLTSDDAAAKTFAHRLRPFLVDNERRKRIVVRVGQETWALPPSDPDGHFAGTFPIPAETAARLAVGGRLAFRAVAGDEQREFTGNAHLIPPDGVSVISDIDDTVKITEVRDKRKALDNTFCQPFRAVAGMAARYQAWVEAGVAVHFVSNSPWQLYEPLQQFFQDAGFPPATFAMKRFRLKDPDSVRKLLDDAGESKHAAIGRFLQDYPRRRFVLIGDSGERDPEIYGAVAQQAPARILRIFIRDVTGEAADAERYQTAFGRLPRAMWHLFRDPAELVLPP